MKAARAIKLGAGLAAVAAGGLAYGFVEARSYRVRTHHIPVLPPGSPELTILQLSDFHLRLERGRMIRFLESLHDQSFDFVFATGDLLGDPESVEECLRLLSGMRAKIGRLFVLGSSDYWAPMRKNYLDYFLHRRRHSTRRNPTGRFRSGLTEQGWIDLNNAETFMEAGRLQIQITGLDDPYLHRDDRRLLFRDPAVQLALLVVHDPAPYDEALAAGYDLVVAGHTHGGQVRVPFKGALVTNSTLPVGLARWLSRIGDGWLFVSPGLGTGQHAPVRFLCPPEASLLVLTPRSAPIEQPPPPPSTPG